MKIPHAKLKKSAERQRRYYYKIKAAGGKIYRDFLKKKRIPQNTYRKKLRLIVIKAYGHKCVCCSEDKQEFLSVDHIRGGGNKHRKKLGHRGSGPGFYKWIIDNKFPRYFQLLCHNCNLSKGFYGYCPHTKIPA